MGFIKLQEVGGETKPYQVPRFLGLVEHHNHTLDSDLGDDHINILASVQAGGYVADIPDLARC